MTAWKADPRILLVVTVFILVLLVIVLVISGTGTGATSLPALPGQSAPDGPAADVTRWMQEHSGQEVFAGEYLDITNPGYLASRPQEVRDAYYRMKVKVPDLNDPDAGMQQGSRSAAIAVLGFREATEDGRMADAGNPYGQCILNESMIAVSNALAAREITAGTYFETVCPDFYYGLPGSQQATLSNRTISVSKIPGREHSSAFVHLNS